MKKSTNLIWVATMSLALSACGQNANFSRGAAHPVAGSDQDRQSIAGNDNEANIRGDGEAARSGGDSEDSDVGQGDLVNRSAGPDSNTQLPVVVASGTPGAEPSHSPVAQASSLPEPLASASSLPNAEASSLPNAEASSTPVVASTVDGSSPEYTGAATTAPNDFDRAASIMLPVQNFELPIVAVTANEKLALLDKLPYIKNNGSPLARNKVSDPSTRINTNKIMVFKLEEGAAPLFSKNQIVRILQMELKARLKIKRTTKNNQMLCLFRPGTKLVCSGNKLEGALWNRTNKLNLVEMADGLTGGESHGLKDGIENEYFVNKIIAENFTATRGNAINSNSGDPVSIDLMKVLSQPRRSEASRLDPREIIFKSSDQNLHANLANTPVYFILADDVSMDIGRNNAATTNKVVIAVQYDLNKAVEAEAPVAAEVAAPTAPAAPVAPETSPAPAPAATEASAVDSSINAVRAFFNGINSGQPVAVPAAPAVGSPSATAPSVAPAPVQAPAAPARTAANRPARRTMRQGQTSCPSGYEAFDHRNGRLICQLSR